MAKATPPEGDIRPCKRNLRIPLLDFIKDKLRNNYFVQMTVILPPLLGQLLMSQNDNIPTWPCRKIAWNRCLNIESRHFRLLPNPDALMVVDGRFQLPS